MATRVFSDAELETLRGFPDITSAELIRYFRLAPSDIEFARRGRGRNNQLGVAVQIAVLSWGSGSCQTTCRRRRNVSANRCGCPASGRHSQRCRRCPSRPYQPARTTAEPTCSERGHTGISTANHYIHPKRHRTGVLRGA